MTDIPNLIEPIDVKIEQIDKTILRPDRGPGNIPDSPLPVPRKTTITLKAQIVFIDSSIEQNHTQIGTDEQARGYLVVRFIDLSSQNITLKRGDKIIQVGNRPCEFYLVHSFNDSAAHFSSESSFTLLRVPFMDRNPIGD
jgi:hypothetical protein